MTAKEWTRKYAIEDVESKSNDNLLSDLLD